MTGSAFSTVDGAVGDPVAEHYGNPVVEQRRLVAGAAVVDLSDRGVVSVSGPDRLTWLDSLTTQAVATLAPGVGTELLQLDPNGHVELAAHLIDDGETAWLLTETPAEWVAWLQRMRFRMRVEVADRGDEFATLGTFGAALDGRAAEANGVPLVWVDPWSAPTGHTYANAHPHPAEEWTYREALVPRAALAGYTDLPAAGTLALEALRIAAWRPRFGREVDERTIPHELDWLRTAVSLGKGCYRGQETVAKVHNLGHPPRRLVMLHLDGSDAVLPPAGAEVEFGGDVAGRVTSSALHHELGPIALAVVKRRTDPAATLTVRVDDDLVAAAQEVIVPDDAGATVEVPRMPRSLARRAAAAAAARDSAE